MPARRVDALAASTEIWGRGGGETMSVRRGNADVAVPAQMLFHPPHAICNTNVEYQTQYDPGHQYDARYARQVATGTTTVCDKQQLRPQCSPTPRDARGDVSEEMLRLSADIVAKPAVASVCKSFA